MIDNGGNIFLFQNSNRYCSDGFDGSCTLFGKGRSGPFTVSACKRNLPSASVDTVTYAGRQDRLAWGKLVGWLPCSSKRKHQVLREIQSTSIQITSRIAIRRLGLPAELVVYLASTEARPTRNQGGWFPRSLLFFQNDSWSRNVYNGPSTFYAWNQGSGDNPVSWSDWTGSVSHGDRCSSIGEHLSGYCTGPFGQDSGSTYSKSPMQTPEAALVQSSSGSLHQLNSRVSRRSAFPHTLRGDVRDLDLSLDPPRK